MRLLVCLLLLCLTVPARAQLDVELRREEISRIALATVLRDAGLKLNTFDGPGARTILDKLVADLTAASHPGEEMRRRVVSAVSVMNAGDLRSANDQLRALFLEVSPTSTEISRAAVGAEMRVLAQSLFGETVPPTMTAAIEELNRKIEPFPSYYRTWTRRQMEALHFACARRDLTQAQNELVVLLKGVGQTAQDLEWRANVEAVWGQTNPDPVAVLAALRAFPNDPPTPAGSPYDHWARVHGEILIGLIQGTASQQALARQEWVLSLAGVREF